MRPTYIKESELRQIIRETTREAVNETLQRFGFDAEHPHEIQADLQYLHNARKGSEFMKMRFKSITLTVVIPATLYALWEALKYMMQKGG